MTTQPTQDIANHSRVWIFGLAEKLDFAKLKTTTEKLKKFTSEWNSHGEPTAGHFEIKYDRFIILTNPHPLGGCSMDSAFNCVKEIETSLTTPSNSNPKLFYRLSSKKITFCERYQIKSLIQKEIITLQTIVFDPTVQSWKDYQDKWEVPAKNTWVNKYFS